MDIEFDEAKNEANVNKHGISLARARDMNILRFLEDERKAYGEARCRAWGLVDNEAYCLVFTCRDSRVRVISLRRAHKKELDRYVAEDRD
ncbi:BrnT family toxin [Rhizobium sp. RU36D]|uniref:BrnT family toxin n=1 Tax=Rhizobium sp. RU36D TaxID=1907415 RepID=UPI0009D7DE90|nr:BrnT family toxin [Rhizobium sp. RU36D]SMC91676.1 hypothetical protein SAMN05880593_11072 [Rhizobium sp. RU36D]